MANFSSTSTNFARGLIGLLGLVAGSALAQEAHTLLNVDCDAPPRWHCSERDCLGAVVTRPGDTVEPQTRRTFFLDCPAGYEPGDEVSILLSLHGGGSYANWQRDYFPAMDVKDKCNPVVLMPGSPYRAWSAADDEYLHNIVDLVVATVGKENVQNFILAGHSQGGRCAIGGRGLGAASAAPPGGDCDYSFIFTNGEYKSIPGATSPLADKYNCRVREELAEVIDPQPGYVWDPTRQDPGSDGWGHYPRSGRDVTDRVSYSQPPDRSSTGRIFMNASTAWIWPS
jgi:pimeloyl-ACP methyl ester carboxylesterase